jgi:filamentous hemagglutinin family protein
MRGVARSLVIALVFEPAVLLAQVTPYGPTTVKHTGNGVPVVNIAAPDANGLSHNQYGAYNVGPEGLILNNSTARVQPTTLGGWINGNPNLRGGTAAQVILNEVTGSGRSFLRGYTEVAGQRAHVIIANPHGITCDGCGFINTPRATLTTGQIVFEQGRPQYDVRGGDILIEGKGLNASNVDRLELITRSARVSAELYAQELDLITGVNRVDANTLTVTTQDPQSIQSSLSAAPKWAVDSSEFGGMYVNAVRLIATERGVGVRLGGDLAARTGDVKIDAKGQLRIERDVGSAAGNVSIALPGGASIKMGPNGQLFAKENLLFDMEALDIGAGETLTAWAKRIEVTGILTNRGDINLGGALEVAKLDNQGKINGNGLLQIKTGELKNSGQLVDDYVALTVAGSLTNTGRIEGKGALEVDAGEFKNSGQLVGDYIALIVAGTLANTGLIEGKGKGGLEIKAAELNNSGQLINDYIVLTVAGSLTNTGRIEGKGGLEIKAAELKNSGQLINKYIDIVVAGILTNTGRIEGNGDGFLKIAAGELKNSGQLINDYIELAVTGTLTNTGRIEGNDALQIKAGELNNSGQLINDYVALTVAGALTNTGLIEGKGSLQIKADELTNSGQLVSDYVALTVAGTLTNTGLIEGRHWLFANAGKDIVLDGTDKNRGVLTSGSAEYAGDIVLLSGGNILFGRTDILTGTATPRLETVSSSDALGDTGGILFYAAGEATVSESAWLQAGTDLIGLAAKGLTLEGPTSHLGAGNDLLLVSGGALTVPSGTELTAGRNLGLVAAGDLNLKANERTEQTRSETGQAQNGEPAQTAQASLRNLATGAIQKVKTSRSNYAIGAAQTIETGHSLIEATQTLHDEGVQLTAGGGILLGAGQNDLAKQWLGAFSNLVGADSDKFTDGRAAKNIVLALNGLLNPPKKEGSVSDAPKNDKPAAVASGNLNIEGGRLDAGGNVVMLSSGKINIKALVDTQTYNENKSNSSISRGGFFTDASSSSSSLFTQTQSVQGFIARIGGDLLISGEGDVTLSAVDIAVKGNVDIASRGGLVIGGVSTTDIVRSEASSNTGSSSSRQSDSTETVTYNGSSLVAGGDISLEASSGLSVIGSEIQGKNISLLGSAIFIGGDFQSSQQSSSQQYEHKYTTNSESGTSTHTYTRNTSSTHSVKEWVGSHLQTAAGGLISLMTYTLTSEQQREADQRKAADAKEEGKMYVGDVYIGGSVLDAHDVQLDVAGDFTLSSVLNSAEDTTSSNSALGKLRLSSDKSSDKSSTTSTTYYTVAALNANTLLGAVQGDVNLYGAQIHANVGGKDPGNPGFYVGGDWTDMALIKEVRENKNIHQTLLESGITGTTNIRIDGDAFFAGTHYSAPDKDGFIHIEVGGKIDIKPIVLHDETHQGYVSSHNKQRDEIHERSVVASFDAQQDLELIAQGDFTAVGGEFRSRHGNALLSSEGDLDLQAAWDYDYTFRKTKSHTYQDSALLVRSVEVSAPEGSATLHAGKKITTESVKLQPKGKLVLDWGVDFIMNEASNVISHAVTKKKKHWGVTKITNKGYVRKEAVASQFGGVDSEVVWSGNTDTVNYTPGVSSYKHWNETTYRISGILGDILKPVTELLNVLDVVDFHSSKTPPVIVNNPGSMVDLVSDIDGAVGSHRRGSAIVAGGGLWDLHAGSGYVGGGARPGSVGIVGENWASNIINGNTPNTPNNFNNLNGFNNFNGLNDVARFSNFLDYRPPYGITLRDLVNIGWTNPDAFDYSIAINWEANQPNFLGYRSNVDEALANLNQTWVNDLATAWQGELVWDAKFGVDANWNYTNPSLSGVGAVIVDVLVSAVTHGITSEFFAMPIPATASIAATTAAAGSVAVQVLVTRDINWNQLFRTGLAATLTKGITQGVEVYHGQTLEELAESVPTDVAQNNYLGLSGEQTIGEVGQILVETGVTKLVNWLGM